VAKALGCFLSKYWRPEKIDLSSYDQNQKEFPLPTIPHKLVEAHRASGIERPDSPTTLSTNEAQRQMKLKGMERMKLETDAEIEASSRYKRRRKS
jgi:hypothetical protein